MRFDRQLGSATRRQTLRSRALRAVLVGMLAVGMAAPAVVAASADDDTTPVPTYRPVTFVQANLNKDMSNAKFQADAASVFAQQPDIITFNEVQRRSDDVLAPEGYDIFRTPGPRTGWAPVVWRSDSWTAVGQGTWQISDRPARFKRGMVGVRFANWVTLAAEDGQVVSVISTHIAPNDKDTAELLLPSLRRLRTLSTELGLLGPVILAGDFNMGYHNEERYRPQILADAGLSNTFDLTGQSFPTHKRGGTIDYIFLGPVDRFLIFDQYPVLMNSDHRMVVAHLGLLPDPDDAVPPPPEFPAGTVVSKSQGTKAERRAIRSLQLRAIKATPAGAAIHIASEKIRGETLLKALTEAKERGADVTVITARRELSDSEYRLRKLLGHDAMAKSYFVRVGRAWPTAGQRARREPSTYLAPTMLLISQAGATAAFAMVADSDLGLSSLRRKRSTVSTASVTTSLKSYDRRYRRYIAAVGRSY